MNDLSFSEWLKRRRKAIGATQDQLARQIGCSAIALRKIESEERRPSEQIVERIAEIFGILPNERKSFLRFARGDAKFAPDEIMDAPWRTRVETTPSVLPITVASLIGREKEIAEVRKYLSEKDVRLVVLIGPLGIGKTRLSIEAARASLADFPDGVFFATLEPLDDPSMIASAIAQTLGYAEAKNQPVLSQLSEGIGNKQTLLVLDNCERFIEDGARIVSSLLATCPRLKILATSREPFRVPGEWLYAVPTLDIPQENSPVDLESASRFPALTLFAERARATRADFALNAENVQAVASICTRLDGLPLAIELIAPRVRFMSPQSLLERMTDSFVLSANGMRAVSARQKTLNNAIAWSYDFLPPEEQRLFSYLSVFSGGFSLNAAEAIFSSMFAERSVAELVGALSDKSLLQRAVEPLGEIRFDMLTAIQQFAREKLKHRGEDEVIRNAHLAYFLDLAEQANREIRGPRQVEWLHRTQNEHVNFRAALDWAIAARKTEAALRTLCALGWPWETRGHYGEARGWLDKIRSLPDVKNYPLLYARTLNHIGRHHWTQDNVVEARALLEESQAIAERLGSDGELSLAETFNWLGLVALLSEHNADAAQSLFRKGLELNQKWEYEEGKALSLFHLGILEKELNHEEEALSLLHQSVAMFRRFGDLFFIARASIFLGYLFIKRGDYDKARAFFEDHLRIDTELNFWDGIAEGWRDLGNLSHHQGDIEKAEELYERSRAVCREHGLNKVVP